MVAAGCALAAYALRWGAPVGPFTLTWWELAPAMALAVPIGFHMELRGEANTFTLSELPLVIGCMFAPPWAVIVARLVGETSYQAARQGQRGLKLVFNMAQLLLGTSASVVLFRLLVPGQGAVSHDWATWPLLLLAMATGDALSMAAVSCAIYWHGGRPRMGTVSAASAVVLVVNVSLALLADAVLRHYPPAIVLLLVVLAVTAVAFRGYSNLWQRYGSLKLLYEFTKVPAAGISAEVILDQMLAKARELLAAEVAEVVLFDGDSDTPALRQRNAETLGSGEGPSSVGPVISVGMAQLLRSGRAILVPRSDRSPAHAALRKELGARDLIIAPLRSDGIVSGALLVANRLGKVSSFDGGDCRLFETLANHTSVALENSRLVHRLRKEAEERSFQALHDALTGLPNRALFCQQVDALAAGDGPSAVMLMDIDRFKEVNDTLGHHNGDLLLCKVASRLRHVLADRGHVARLGGDEFAIHLPGMGSTQAADVVAPQLLEALRQPLAIDDLVLDVGASIGIAAAPEHGLDAATLLQKADVAMYQAKSSHRGACVYSPEKDTYSPRRLALTGALRQAVDNGDILVYFQPKISLRLGAVEGAEALVRWRHPEMGMLTPDEFIPVAEASGLIVPLTTHVLRSALRQCTRWRQAGHAVGVAVNLSVRSLIDHSLPGELGALLAGESACADWLTLEITESSVMAEPSRTIDVLERLAAMGVRLSVDDFGTGYSSLAYLQRLPVHEVKVDKSFVLNMSSSPGDAAIVQSIIELGHNLGLSVVAEGVEDQIILDRLRALDCDVAQGYHISKPVPAPTITRWLDDRRRTPDLSAGQPRGPLTTRSVASYSPPRGA